jgi:hypothetical protein
MQAFRELEQLVAKIQKSLAPRAEVLHSVFMEGRQSKRRRQVDVLVHEKIGQYEINIVIDCKDYKKPIDVKGVEEFDGLLADVGAQKGVLVCPAGFTKAAKTRADGLQIDLYSPFDTGLHKWQVKATIPAVCDFRSARMGFGVQVCYPAPFRLASDFFTSTSAYSKDGRELGTPLAVASRRWDNGEYPIEPGVHESIAVFETRQVMFDNGYGQQIPTDIYLSLLVDQELYYGPLPVPHVSGFKDELTGKVITNAFQIGMLDPNEVTEHWLKIKDVSDAPVRPGIIMQGLIAWTDIPD